MEYTTERLSVSPDGQTLTETHLGKRPDGTPYETVLIFQSESEQAVTDTERRWEDALKQFDSDAMESLLAEDDLQTDFRGFVQDKASWIQDFKQAVANVHSGESQWAISFDDEKMRIYGDAAIVTGQGTFKGHKKGGAPVNRIIRFTNMWVKRQGAWQLVNYQATPILLPPATAAK